MSGRINISDSVGAINTPRAFFDRLSDAGVAVLEFNPINPLEVKTEWLINNRDHRKLLVVDGRTAFIGGINISSVYSSGPSLKRSIKANDNAQGKDIVRAIGSTPDDPYSLIYLTLISAIGNAEKQVQLTNAYFVPDPHLLNSLIEAAGRGVDVTLILPSHSDSDIVFHVGRAHYSTLLKAGVKIFERHGALLHSKTAVIDGVWSCVGSTNLDWRSVLDNDEINAVILGRDFAQQMQVMFDKELSASKAIDLVAWESRHLIFRIKEWGSGWLQRWL